MKSKLLRDLKEAWESGDADAIARLYSARAFFLDGVGQGEQLARGPRAIRSLARKMFKSPGARFRVTSLSSTSYGGVAEWTFSWTADRRGRRRELRGASVIVTGKSRVVRELSYYNPVPEIE